MTKTFTGIPRTLSHLESWKAAIHGSPYICYYCDREHNYPAKLCEGCKRKGVVSRSAHRDNLLTSAREILKQEDPQSERTWAELAKYYGFYAEKNTEGEKDEHVNFTPTVFLDGVLYEQIYDKINGARYAYLRGDSVCYCRFVKDGELVYRPIEGEELVKGAIALPSEAIPTTDVLGLLRNISAYITKYCDVSPQFREVSSDYVLLTYFFDKARALPYLRSLGDHGTGKSRYQTVVGGICFRSVNLAGAMGAAPMFRLIDKWKGTTIVDEGDLKRQGEEADALNKVLCVGFEPNSFIARCSGDDNKLQFFSAFSPKIISSRKPFEDSALESRCLTEVMRMTNRRDIPTNLPVTFAQEQLSLRNRLLYVRLKYWAGYDADKTIPLPDTLEPRLRQILHAVGSVIVNFSGGAESFGRFAAQFAESIINERANTLDGAIVRALLELRDTKGEEPITASDILAKVKEAGYDKINAPSIGSRLRGLGLISKPRKYEGRTYRAVCFDNEQLKTLKVRYVPDDKVTAVTGVTAYTEGGGYSLQNLPPLPATAVTVVTTVTRKVRFKQNVPAFVIHGTTYGQYEAGTVLELPEEIVGILIRREAAETL